MQLFMLVVVFTGFTGEFYFGTTVLLRHGPQHELIHCTFSRILNIVVVMAFSFLISTGESHQQTIRSIQDRVHALQGNNVTLSCKYSSAAGFAGEFYFGTTVFFGGNIMKVKIVYYICLI